MSDWYDKTSAPTTRSALSSSIIRSEFTLIDTAMQNLPTFTGNGGKFCVVNAGGTALIASDTIALAVTTGTGLTLAADALTTGSILVVTSNSADTSTRNLVFMRNDNTLATGATVLSIQQDAAQTAIFIDQNGNGRALNIASDATTSDVIEAIADSLTTGRILDLKSNSSDTGSRQVARIHNDNASATGAIVLSLIQDSSATALLVDQNGAGTGILIDQDGNGIALSIDTESTTADAISIAADALTSGKGLNVTSNSASTSTRSLVRLLNNNALASGTTVLTIEQDADKDAVLIDQDGNGICLNIVTVATTADAINISGNSITTGRLLDLTSTSTSTSTRDLARIVNDSNLATGATVLRLQQDAAQDGLFVDMNGNGTGITISSDATTNTNLDLAGNSLTTGKLINASSNSADTGTRQLVSILNLSSLATGATCLSVRQDAAQKAVLIDMNGNGTALEIDTESTTTANVINILSNTVTTGNIFNVGNADALTTGAILNLDSNSSSTSTRDLVRIVNDNTLATGTTALCLRQDAAQDVIFIDLNADGTALEIDTESTTASVINIQGNTVTTGYIFNAANANALTTGGFLNLTSSSASTSTRTLVNILNDNTLATGATVLKVRQDAAQTALFVDQNGNGIGLNVASDATTADAINVNADSLTTGRGLDVASNSSSASARDLVRIVNDNSAASGTKCLRITQDANNDGIFIDGNGNGIALDIDSEATSNSSIRITAAATSGDIFAVTADSLTMGSILNLISNSADTSTRSLVQVANDNTLATGTTCLTIQQDAAQTALFIDQNGNGVALNIASDATEADTLNISADSLTTGRVMDVTSNSSSTSTRDVVRIVNDNALAIGATALKIQQYAAKYALDIDQIDGNHQAVRIKSTSTSANVFLVSNDALTTGFLADFNSNSADTGTRSLVRIINDNALASGTRCLQIFQDADQDGIFINMNGNGIALDVDSESTSAASISIATAATTASIIDIASADALTTGKILNLVSNSASTGTRSLVQITNDNTLATGTTALSIQQDAAQDAVVITQTAAAHALFIDHNADGRAISVGADCTTATAVNINASSLTTGSALNVTSNSANNSARAVVTITNNNTLATGATALGIQQDATDTDAISVTSSGTNSDDFFRVFYDTERNASGIGTIRISGNIAGSLQITSETSLDFFAINSNGTNDMLFQLLDKATSTVDKSFLAMQSSGGVQLYDSDGDFVAMDTTANVSDQSVNFYGHMYNDAATSAFTIRIRPIYEAVVANSANVHVDSAGRLRRETSSQKYKNTIETMTYGLTEVMSLRPVTYFSNAEDNDRRHAGFIAEEINDLGLTEFVEFGKDGTPEALHYSHMTSMLAKAIQELKAEIEVLKSA